MPPSPCGKAALSRGGITGAHSKKRQNWLFPLLAVVVGVACIAYPYVSDALYKQAQEKVAYVYDVAVEAADPESLDEEWAKANDYNQSLSGSKVVVTDPFDPAQPVGSLPYEYEDLLNLAGDGTMGTLTIPAVGIRTVIYHGVSDEVLAVGCGHLQETTLPVGGEGTHCVLAGHTGLPTVRVFDALDEVQVGDIVVLHVLDQDLAYCVTATEVVLPNDTSSLANVPGKDLLTLVTCTPYGVNSHRLLVHAERCDLPADWNVSEGDFGTTVSRAPVVDSGLLRWAAFGAIAGIVVGVGSYAVFSLVRRRDE